MIRAERAVPGAVRLGRVRRNPSLSAAYRLIALSLLLASCSIFEEAGEEADSEFEEVLEDSAEEAQLAIECPSVSEGSTTLADRFDESELVRTFPQPAYEIDVTDRGAEPREELRYDLVTGDLASVVSTLESELTQTVGSETTKSELTATTRLDIEVGQPSAEEVVRYGAISSYELETSDPAAAEQADTTTAFTTGLVSRETSGTDGVPAEVLISTTAPVPPVLEPSLDDFSTGLAGAMATFPQEAIGSGARWTVAFPTTFQGLEANAMSTITLTGRAGSLVSLDVDLDLEYPPQEITIPNSEPVTVEEGSLAISGSLALDLAQPGPCSTELSGEGDLAYRDAATAQTFTQHTEMTQTVVPAE